MIVYMCDAALGQEHSLKRFGDRYSSGIWVCGPPRHCSTSGQFRHSHRIETAGVAGAYGAVPGQVLSAQQGYQRQMEANIEVWINYPQGYR
jgi:hypothetical protein